MGIEVPASFSCLLSSINLLGFTLRSAELKVNMEWRSNSGSPPGRIKTSRLGLHHASSLGASKAILVQPRARGVKLLGQLFGRHSRSKGLHKVTGWGKERSKALRAPSGSRGIAAHNGWVQVYWKLCNRTQASPSTAPSSLGPLSSLNRSEPYSLHGALMARGSFASPSLSFTSHFWTCPLVYNSTHFWALAHAGQEPQQKTPSRMLIQFIATWLWLIYCRREGNLDSGMRWRGTIATL